MGSVPRSSAGGGQELLPPPPRLPRGSRQPRRPGTKGSPRQGPRPALRRAGRCCAAPPGTAPSPSRAAKYSPGPRRRQRPLPGSDSGPGPLRRHQTPAARHRTGGTGPPPRFSSPALTGRPLTRGKPHCAPSSGSRWRAGASTAGSCPRPSAAAVPHRSGQTPPYPAPPPLWQRTDPGAPGPAEGGTGWGGGSGGAGRRGWGRTSAAGEEPAQGHGGEGRGSAVPGAPGGCRERSPPPCLSPGPHSPCCG